MLVLWYAARHGGARRQRLLLHRGCAGLATTTATPPPPPPQFAEATTPSLLRAYAVFTLCTVKPLVANATRLLGWSDALIGRDATTWLLQRTFFAHFCGGTDAEAIKPVVDRLARAGVSSILDYAAEADITPEAAAAATSAAATSAAAMDATLAMDLRGVRDAAAVGGFAAFKLTALAPPALLVRISALLEDHTRAFSSLSNNGRAAVGLPRFLEATGLTEEAGRTLFDRLDHRRDGELDALEWADGLALLRLTGGASHHPAGAHAAAALAALGCGNHPPLSSEEVAALDGLLRRAEALASTAHANGVTVMIDAEQTYLQGAIEWVSVGLMRKYNRGVGPSRSGGGERRPVG